MNEMNRRKWVDYLINGVVALVIALLIAFGRGLSTAQRAAENFSDLSDGFFVAGGMMIGVGLLSLIATTGFFDIFSYGMKTLVSHFKPSSYMEDTGKYYDYKMARAEKRKKPLRASLYVGLACIALSLACLGGYYSF